MSDAIPAGEQAELARLRVLARRLGVAEDVRLLSPWTPLPGAGARACVGRSRPAAALLAGPVLGVTGTAGKTTTARLAEAMLRASGVETLTSSDAPADNAWPTADLLERALAARPPAWCVAELTSNHLAVCSASPQIACITNVWADHVDQHGSLAAYLEAKRRIVAFQGPDDWTVVNGDDPGAARARRRLARARPALHAAGPGERPRRAARVRAPDRPARRPRLTTSGRAAPCRRRPPRRRGCWPAACALLAGASPRGASPAALAAWKGLALRRERLGEIDGCEVIRDALAATPAKAAAGLALHAPGSVVLIAGGYDDLGGGPMHDAPQERALFEHAAAVAARACAHAALFGPAAPRLAAALRAAGLASISVHETLAEACSDARAHAAPGRTILFAPWFATSPSRARRDPGTARPPAD